jgi:hypothetical protein
LDCERARIVSMRWGRRPSSGPERSIKMSRMSGDSKRKLWISFGILDSLERPELGEWRDGEFEQNSWM